MSFQVTIIIPTYNRADSLIRAVESVLAQTYTNFILFIVDDGSTDETFEKLAPYLNNSKVQYLKQENKGVSCARNLGIKNSPNEWIALLDSDDEWLPEKLKIQVDFSLSHPYLRFIHSNEIWIRNGVRVNPKNKFDKSNHEIFKRSLETCLISASTTLIKKELLIEHGLFDETFPICEDFDMWLKILATEGIGFITDNLVKKYGGHKDQLSTKYPAMDFWRIRSLINLALKSDLNPEKKSLILDEIHKKAPILKAGFVKYNQSGKLLELSTMLKRLKSAKS